MTFTQTPNQGQSYDDDTAKGDGGSPRTMPADGAHGHDVGRCSSEPSPATARAGGNEGVAAGAVPSPPVPSVHPPCNRAHPPTAWCPAAPPDAPCPAADDGRHRGERDADERGGYWECFGCGLEVRA
jgi:hypothetical protein